jgi:thermitase
MKKIIFILTAFLSNVVFSQVNEEFVKNHLIVKINSENFNPTTIDLLHHSFGNSNLDNLNASLNVSKIESIGQFTKTRTFLIVFNDDVNIPETIHLYRNTNVFDYVEPDYIAYSGGVKNTEVATTTPNDGLYSRQWGLFNNGTFTVSGMPYSSTNDADSDMELAWDIQTGNPNLIIAVPDTGIRLTHNDIASRIWNKSSIEPIDGIDNDGNGLIDDYQGWDWINNDNNPSDDYGHGTNCAGIVGAVANNSEGYAGVNWNSKIMALKVLNNANSGTYSAMSNSIYYAADNGAKIISMSIGGSSSSTALSDALVYANTLDVTFVVCMMNFNNNTTYYPAGYAATIPNVIAVGSTNSNDKRTSPFFWSATSGSNYGNHLSVVAPGNYIWGLDYLSNSGYNSYWGGTSQATPLVAGIASLLKSQNASLTPTQIKSIIQTTSQDQVGLASEDVAGWDQYMGWGRVNAYAALQQVLAIDNFENETVDVKIINPIKNNKLAIEIGTAFENNYQLTFYSFDGKLLKVLDAKLLKGLNTIPFDFKSGNYLLEIKSKTYSKIFKLVKK